VEFSDFQCPFCAATQQALREVRAKYPNDVALIYRHLPIEAIHPYAFDASLAAECAADQAHFAELSDTLYADQRDIGHRSWGDFSHAAGIADTAALVDCVRKRVYSGRILTDKAAAAKLGIEGTPTFVLNGHVIIGGVSFATLDSAVRSEMGLRKVALSKTIGSR
jgi:protein-disulfide isomerase